MVMEYRPLLSETRLNANEKREGSRKTLYLGIIAIVAIIGLFFVFNNGSLFHKKKHYGGTKSLLQTRFAASYSETDMEFDRDNQFDFTTDKSLHASKFGQSLELDGEEWGELSLEKFSSMFLQGELVFADTETVLAFMIDANQKMVSFERHDLNTDEVLNSFFTQKTADLLQEDHYEIDGFTIDPTDEQATEAGFKSFFESDLVTHIIGLSLQVASKGYTGDMAKSVRMLHAFAVHMVEVSSVKERMPLTFELNRQKLNDMFTSVDEIDDEDVQVKGEAVDPDSQQIISLYNGGIEEDYCILFWCTSSTCPGSTGDGCPSTCYVQGACEEEDKCDNECFGGCGDGCDCWSWVCGDCACHCLCENHDYFCSCISLSTYQCWAMWSWLDDDCD